MARIEKYSSGIVGVIKHNIREFKDGICPTNTEVDPSKISDNYALLRRGNTAKEIEKYRKQLMKEIFHYKRKNIVLCNEVVCTLPSDCPPEQEKAFFEESFKYICSTLPMGEKSVLLAEVHRDEGCVLKDGKTVAEGAAHLHVMYVPAVRDTKHEGFSFRLCSDELTKRAILKQWHPNYQKWLDDAGVHATVATGVTSGRGISVKSLKELSRETGFTLDQILDMSKVNALLRQQIKEQHQTITAANEMVAQKDTELVQALERIQELETKLEHTVSKEHEHTHEWGSITEWGSHSITIEEEKLW